MSAVLAGDAEKHDHRAQEDADNKRCRGKDEGDRDGHEHCAEDHSTDCAFDGFLRTDGRRQRPPAERATRVVLRRVADHNGGNQQQRRLRAGERLQRDEHPERRANVDRRDQIDGRLLNRSRLAEHDEREPQDDEVDPDGAETERELTIEAPGYQTFKIVLVPELGATNIYELRKK